MFHFILVDRGKLKSAADFHKLVLLIKPFRSKQFNVSLYNNNVL